MPRRKAEKKQTDHSGFNPNIFLPKSFYDAVRGQE
jgi:hypothetical protein